MSVRNGRARVASVEDWDDTEESPFTNNSPFRLKKEFLASYRDDDVDSGYGSRATSKASSASIASMYGHRRGNVELEYLEGVERERKPHQRPETFRTEARNLVTQDSGESKEAEPAKSVKAARLPFCHNKGICWVCDKHGYHFDPNNDLLATPQRFPTAVSKSPIPQYPAPATRSIDHTREITSGDESQKPMRRMSSNLTEPTSMYAAAPSNDLSYRQYILKTLEGQSGPSLPPVDPSAYYTYHTPAHSSVDGRPLLQRLPTYDITAGLLSSDHSKLEEKPQLLEQYVMMDKSQTDHATASTDVNGFQEYKPGSSRYNVRISEDEWNRHKPTLRKLCDAKLTRQQILDIISKDFGDRKPTYGQLCTKFDKWGFAPYRKSIKYSKVDRALMPPPPKASHGTSDLGRPRKAGSYQQDMKTLEVASSSRAPQRATTEYVAPPQTAVQMKMDAAEAYMRKRSSYSAVDLTDENVESLKTVLTRHANKQGVESEDIGSQLTRRSSSRKSSNSNEVTDPWPAEILSNDSLPRDTTSSPPKTSMNINIDALNLNIGGEKPDHGDDSPMTIDLGNIRLHLNNNTGSKEQNAVLPTFPVQDLSTWESQTIHSDNDRVWTPLGIGLSEEFSRSILKDIGGSIVDPQIVSNLCNNFENLLTNFANRLRLESPWNVPRHVVTLFHTYKRLMSNYMKQALSADSAKGSGKISSMAPIPLTERMQDWLSREDDFENEAPRSPTFELPEQLVKETHDLPKELAKYKTSVSNTASYRWLIESLRNLTLLTESSVQVKQEIRDELFKALPKPGLSRTTRFAPTEDVMFIFVWNTTLIGMMKGAKSVASILTITGSACDAQVLTCEEYLKQTWPSTGMYVVRLIDKAIMLKALQSAKVRRPDGAAMEVSRMGCNIGVKVSGTRDIILEVAEQLSWITAALNLPHRSGGLILCTPAVRYAGHRYGLAADLTATKSSGQNAASELITQLHHLPATYTNKYVTFRIELDYNETIADNKPGCCWYKFFECCTIIQGFPIRRRQEPSLGLELALNVISWLVDTKHLQQFAGSVFLKSLSAVLSPVRQLDNVLVWHLCCSNAKDPISYLGDETPDVCKIDVDGVLGSRHVVGWCSDVENFCGAADGQYDAEKSMIPLSDSNGLLHGCDLIFGSLIVGGNEFTPTNNHKPTPEIRRTYLDTFRYLEQRFVLFWDTRDERGWLVNGLQALLHLLRQSFKIDKDEDASGGMFVLKPEDLEEPAIPHDAGAARVFLNNVRNLCAKVSVSSVSANHQEYEVLADRLQQFFDVIEKGFNYQKRYKERKEVPRSRLEGWDFVSLASKEDPVEPLMVTLPSVGKSWVDLLRGLGAITFFGEGFGELLKSAKCGGLPCNRFYMACTVPSVRQIMTQARCDRRRTPRMVSQSPRIMWYGPPRVFDDHSETDTNATSLDAFTQVLWPREHVNLLPGPSDDLDLEKHSTGAIMFGHHSSLTHYIPDFGPPILGSPPTSDQDLELFEDSGIGSSVSDKRTDDTPSTTTALSPYSPPSSSLMLPDQGQQYGNSSISGGYTILGNVHGNITVQHYSSPVPK